MQSRFFALVGQFAVSLCAMAKGVYSRDPVNESKCKDNISSSSTVVPVPRASARRFIAASRFASQHVNNALFGIAVFF